MLFRKMYFLYHYLDIPDIFVVLLHPIMSFSSRKTIHTVIFFVTTASITANKIFAIISIVCFYFVDCTLSTYWTFFADFNVFKSQYCVWIYQKNTHPQLKIHIISILYITVINGFRMCLVLILFFSFLFLLIQVQCRGLDYNADRNCWFLFL